MAYYLRVLSTADKFPAVADLRAALVRQNLDALIDGDEPGSPWTSVLLKHVNDEPIAELECSPCVDGELGAEEIEEFREGVEDYRPASAVRWLRDYLLHVRIVFSFRVLSGADQGAGWDMIHALQSYLWSLGPGILQSDGEGFSNEDGNHILWQFDDGVTGPWNMAVLRDDGNWLAFQMELGSSEHRAAFLDGKVPGGVEIEST